MNTWKCEHFIVTKYTSTTNILNKNIKSDKGETKLFDDQGNSAINFWDTHKEQNKMMEIQNMGIEYRNIRTEGKDNAMEDTNRER